MMLLENYLSDYMEAELKLLMGNSMQKEDVALEFRKWKNQNKKIVEIKDFESVDTDTFKELKLNVEKGIIKPKIKSCFENSWKITSYSLHDIKYVEGYGGFSGIPIEHAWNYADNTHFDLTAQLALGSVNSFDSYLSILELDRRESFSLASDLGTSGPFALAYFFKYILKKWDKKTIQRVKVLSS